MQQEIIFEAKKYIGKLFSENSGGHDVNHTLRVFSNALQIASGEPGCDIFIVSLAALLHDVDDHKLFATLDNQNARTFLRENWVPDDYIERICTVINSVSFSKNKGKVPSSLEAKVVQDADRLDAIGAIGIARTFAYGGEHGRSMEASIDHFHEKLLLLKDLMNTDTAKTIAQKRHDFMVSFLEEWNQETERS